MIANRFGLGAFSFGARAVTVTQARSQGIRKGGYILRGGGGGSGGAPPEKIQIQGGEYPKI